MTTFPYKKPRSSYIRNHDPGSSRAPVLESSSVPVPESSSLSATAPELSSLCATALESSSLGTND